MKVINIGCDVEFVVKNGNNFEHPFNYVDIGKDEGMVELRPEPSLSIGGVIDRLYNLIDYVESKGWDIVSVRWAAGGHLHLQFDRVLNWVDRYAMLLTHICYPHLMLQGLRMLYPLSLERYDNGDDRVEIRSLPSLLWLNRDLVKWSIEKIIYVIENISSISLDEILDYSEILPLYREYVKEIVGMDWVVVVPTNFKCNYPYVKIDGGVLRIDSSSFEKFISEKTLENPDLVRIPFAEYKMNPVSFKIDSVDRNEFEMLFDDTDFRGFWSKILEKARR